MVKVTKHGGKPGSAQGIGSVDGTQGLTQQQSWEMLCSVQGDMRRMSRVSEQTLDVLKKMLEEIQDVGRGIDKLVDENGKLTDKIDTLVEKTGDMAEKTEILVEENQKATDAIQVAVNQNSHTALDIQEAIEKLVLVNQQNVDQMSGDAEVLIKSAATLAISQVEGKKFDDAATEAEEKLASGVEMAGQLRQWVKAVNKKQVEDEVGAKFAEKRKELESK